MLFRSERELFETITALSYDGDIRMILPAENRSKVSNIVKKQAPQFKELYQRLAAGLPGVHWSPYASTIEQDVNPQMRAAHIKKLPPNLRERLTARYSLRSDIPPKESDESAFWLKVAGDKNLEEVLRSGSHQPTFLPWRFLSDHILTLPFRTEMRSIVRYPTIVQTAKGILSAGPGKSLRYSAEKIGKWRGGK